jgi:hypothetical protein
MLARVSVRQGVHGGDKGKRATAAQERGLHYICGTAKSRDGVSELDYPIWVVSTCVICVRFRVSVQIYTDTIAKTDANYAGRNRPLLTKSQ